MDMTFTKEAWYALKAYFEAAYQQLGDLELQGYGRVRMEDGGPVCFEVGIPEQEVGMVKTDATWDQMLAFLQEKVNFKDKRARLEVPTWRLWWHTHGRGGFSVKYSGTDDDTIRALAAEAGDHMWGLVFHTDTMDSTLYLATRKPVPLYAELGKAVCEFMDTDIPDDINEEVALKVTKKVWAPPVAAWAPRPWKPNQYAAGDNHPDGCLCGTCTRLRASQAGGTHPDGCLCIICEQLEADAAAERGYDLTSPLPEYLGGGADAE